MRNKILIGAVLLISIAGLLAYNIMNMNKSLSVALAEAEEGALVESVFASGRLEPATDAVLFIPYSGTVEQVAVREGDRVKAGQTLLAMSTDAWEEQIRAERNNRAMIVAEQNRYRKQAFESAKPHLQSGKSVSDFLDEDELRMYELRLELSDQAIASLQDKIQRRELKASIDGVVTEVSVKAGQSAGEGSPAVRIVDDRKLEVRAYLNELDAGKVSERMEAVITGDAFDQSLQGVVSYVAPIAAPADPSSREPSVEVRVDVLDAADGLRPGLGATIELMIQYEPRVLVPLRSVRLIGDEAYVYIVQDGTAVQKSVRVGRDDGDRIEILEGLTAGDAVIAELTDEVKDGRKVNVP